MNKNDTLRTAKTAKNDEFYTRIETVEKEMKHYRDYFKGKSVYLNCDADWSNFFVFFKTKFTEYGLKKVVATHYAPDGVSIKREIIQATGDNGNALPEDIIETPLHGNGDFRSDESVQLLTECDIVVTNPPFSLLREFVDLLMVHDKQFLFLGNNAVITYKNVFSYIMEERLWLGVQANVTTEFQLHPDYTKWSRVDEEGNKYGKVAISWFTNLSHKKRNEKLTLVERYSEDKFPVYDNYNAINVDKVKNIPEDYYDLIGVPITFLTKHNPEQFELLGYNRYLGIKALFIKGKEKYDRLIIKRKQ